MKPTLPKYDVTSGKRIGGTIENWSMHCWSKSQEVYVVCGNIYGDSCWFEGQSIRTSQVVKLDEEKGLLETLNTIYQLGTKYVEEKLDD